MENNIVESRGTFRSLVAALVVAMGVAIAWGIVSFWVGGLVDSWLRPNNTAYEDLVVTRNGTPAIRSFPRAGFADFSYRTLTGEPLEVGNDGTIGGAYLGPPARPARFFSTPIGWGQSLAAAGYGRPPAVWYLVRNNQQNGSAYFVGYDRYSKLPLGYIARSGFRRNQPPADDWFQVGLANGYFGWAASTGDLSLNSPTGQFQTDDNSNLPAWLVYVVDGDRIQEVNLRERSVREVLRVENLVAVRTLSEAVPVQANAGQEDNRPKALARVAVRTRDRVIVFDPVSGEKREYVLPESLTEERLNVYSIGGEQLILSWSTFSPAENKQHLTWIGPDGTIAREESFQLARSGDYFGPRTLGAIASVIAPIPIGWAAMLGVVVPVGMMNDHQAPTYAAALAEVFDVASWGMVLVAVIGCLSAWVVGRWQKKYFRPATGAWCTFAFFLGLPAVVAYWLEMRRAKLEACGECHTLVPRDRDACASCAQPFPEPPLVGKEIFA